jgi:hypothetical protein
MIDFGRGPVIATRVSWGDVFLAYYSTGIPNMMVACCGRTLSDAKRGLEEVHTTARSRAFL